MKPITVICGPNHSGTSYVAELLIKAGADPGEYTREMPAATPYIKYENNEFKAFVAATLGIATDYERTDEPPALRFRRFLATLDPDRAYVLKYPKSVFLLDPIARLIGERARLVYVRRNWDDWMSSYQSKTGANPAEAAHYFTRCAQEAMACDTPILIVRFEALLAGRGHKQLLAWAGMEGE